MRVGKIGEFGLIERIKKNIKTDPSVVVASGDDCAVIRFTKDQYQLFTCDMIVQDVDFTLRDNPRLIGRKALAVSVSDIAACGGRPTHCLVSLGMPGNTGVELVDKISLGMFALAREYRVNIVGGDLSRADRLIIDVSMLGLVGRKQLCLRSGARRGDMIFVTGSLGGSIRGKHLDFTPRQEESQFLVNNFKINSMIDISDGLAQDLGQIIKASRVGAVIYENLLPFSREARDLSEVLYMGEDFELLFTLSREQAKKLLRRKDTRFKCIGEIVDAKYGLKLLAKDEREKNIKTKGGFRHF